MRFTSDNNASVHPAVLQAVVAAKDADTSYDGDRISAALDTRFSELFETDVAVLPVGTGTAANGLALAALCPPYGGIICHSEAHINIDEAGGPEFFTHGAKLLPIAAQADDFGKLTPSAIAQRIDSIPKDVHRVQPGALSITNATELGCVYTVEETAAIGALARERGLGFHIDGARFANAVAHLGCMPADLSWRAGADMLSFGFTKNGGMTSEALVCFRPELVHATRIRRKRSGHLLSKGRFQAAQLIALLESGLWLENARSANSGARRLGEAAGTRLRAPVEANEVFVTLTAGEANALRAAGFLFYDWGDGTVRFVVSWDQPAEDVEALAGMLAKQAASPLR